MPGKMHTLKNQKKNRRNYHLQYARMIDDMIELSYHLLFGGVNMEHRVKSLEERVTELERNDRDKATRLAVAENNIKELKADISAIKDDTKWLRRTITNALIATPIIAVITGVIGLIFWVIKGGV